MRAATEAMRGDGMPVSVSPALGLPVVLILCAIGLLALAEQQHRHEHCDQHPGHQPARVRVGCCVLLRHLRARLRPR